jgi:hypothetical protein
MVQIVWYKDSPVGSYNELMVLPGLFDVPKNAEGKDRGKKRKTLRITRIYVDQKETTYNGVYDLHLSSFVFINNLFCPLLLTVWNDPPGHVNWNIPKHLARFSFERFSSPTRLKVQLFPPSSSTSNPETEKPFISITLQPFVYVPALPFSTKVLPWLGLDGALTQPPLLPQPDGGKGLVPELRAGSEEWLQTTSVVRCKKMRGCWVDYEQPGSGLSADGDGAVVENKGWFPTIHPYRFGMWLEGAEIAVPIAEVL